MKLELRFPVAENAEDVRRQVCITMTGGSYKDVKAYTGRRVQVRRFDSFLPGVEGSFVLWLISNGSSVTCNMSNLRSVLDWQYQEG